MSRIAAGNAIRPSPAGSVLALVTLYFTASACDVPRTTADTATPRTRFIALARERGPQHQSGWSDLRITLWSICPDLVEEPASRRRVLGPSPWLPTPLLDSPAILRWQVPTERRETGNGYTVRLLKIDFATFEVAELLATDQAFAIGRSGDRVYLDTSDGQFVLDRESGELTVQEPAIELLISRGDRWLVGIDGQVAEFDAAHGEVVELFDEIPAGERWDSPADVVWDGGPYAVSLGELLDEQRQPIEVVDHEKWEIVYRDLAVWNLGAGSHRTLLARNQAQGGSGVCAIPVLVTVEIDGDRMRYVERRPPGGVKLAEPDPERDYEWVSVDLSTGKELGRALYSPGREEPLEPEIDLPHYLREPAARSPTRSWGPLQGMAYAFLVLQGVSIELPEHGVQKLDAVARSSDGREVLVLHDGTLFLGDLETQSVRWWPAPAPLTKCLVELHAAGPR